MLSKRQKLALLVGLGGGALLLSGCSVYQYDSGGHGKKGGVRYTYVGYSPYYAPYYYPYRGPVYYRYGKHGHRHYYYAPAYGYGWYTAGPGISISF